MGVGPGTPEEFKKGKYTLGFVVYAFALGAFVGAVYVGIQFNLAEVGGVRNDMVKEDQHLQKEVERIGGEMEKMRQEINARVDRKLKNHELIYHKEK